MVAGVAPVHRVIAFARWVDRDDQAYTDWRSACGAEHTEAGWHRTLTRAGAARVGELCRLCFPEQDATRPFPDPADHSRPDGRQPRSLEGDPPEHGTAWSSPPPVGSGSIGERLGPGHPMLHRAPGTA